ncbi:MAG: OB-fold nucleic acid binding domain-containing protein, partial [Candidatus Omnitrophica bacterium]|nr:OB-fold nucleic acid binding domain-containing protein [Candidatus Omnitrophota bacterium]
FFGLAAIKGVGEVAVQSILSARQSGGKFKSLAELCERVDSRTVNRKVLEALIKCGACDAFKQTRAAMFAQIDQTLARAASIAQDRLSGQGSLFGFADETPSPAAVAAESMPEWPQKDRLAAEKELLGFYVTGHPLKPYLPLIEKYALTNVRSLSQLPNRNMTRLAGVIAAVQNGVSKKTNKPYAMVTLEDMEASVPMLFFNENYDKYRPLLVEGNVVLVIGEINQTDDKPKLFPQEMMLLEDAPRRFTTQVHLRLRTTKLDRNQLEAVRSLVAAYPGKCPLFLCFIYPTGETVFIETHDRFWVAPSRAFQQAVEDKLGNEAYYAKVDQSLPERAARKWEPSNGNSTEG